MSVKTAKFKIGELTPLRTHNAALADKTDPYAMQISVLSKKRNRTQEEENHMRSLEARGGMYVRDGKIVLPSGNIKAMIVDAAKTERKGKAVTRFFNMLGDVEFTFEGEQDPDKRIEDDALVDKRIVSLNPQTKTKGIRSRPIYNGWAVAGSIRFEDSEISMDEVKRFFERASIVGLCERYDGFGQFEVVYIK